MVKKGSQHASSIDHFATRNRHNSERENGVFGERLSILFTKAFALASSHARKTLSATEKRQPNEMETRKKPQQLRGVLFYDLN